MLKYILKRIVLMLPVIIGITFVIYMILALAPGDPVSVILGPDAEEEARVAMAHRLGLDRNVVVRYLIYMESVIQGDLGVSWLNRKPVIMEFMQRFPNTLALAFSSLVITIVFGLSFGVLAAIRQNKPLDGITLLFALLFSSIPAFWSGLVMQLFFALKLRWLPAMGLESVRHVILPAVTLSMVGLANQVRMTRSSMLDVLSMDYIRTARAKGAGEFRVIVHHVIRNGLMPVVTNLGISFAGYMGGSVITETVFAVPGIGSYIVSAVKGRDVPVVMGVIIFIAIFVSVINLLVDIVYAFIDPKVKLGYMS